MIADFRVIYLFNKTLWTYFCF